MPLPWQDVFLPRLVPNRKASRCCSAWKIFLLIHPLFKVNFNTLSDYIIRYQLANQSYFASPFKFWHGFESGYFAEMSC